MASESYVLARIATEADALDALIIRAQKGDEAAFEEILRGFESRALATARQLGATRADAEDIAQDAFVKLFRHIDSYRGGRKFTAYFYRIVVNATRDHLSRRGPQAPDIERHEPRRPGHGGGTADAERRELVREALMQLSDREREVVILKDLHGLSSWEVARVLGLNPITVRRHAMRARARLKEILGLSS